MITFVPSENMKEEKVTVLKPKLHPEKCTACRKSVETCGYNALALDKNYEKLKITGYLKN
jgi:formate hydrogenlyase subunit 6/NADH:ubiquinone oxidoreductase subunit I